jgi:hypothetical protein
MTLSRWEIVRCGGCGHEHPREALGRHVLPCSRCSDREAVVVPLLEAPLEFHKPAGRRVAVASGAP